MTAGCPPMCRPGVMPGSVHAWSHGLVRVTLPVPLLTTARAVKTLGCHIGRGPECQSQVLGMVPGLPLSEGTGHCGGHRRGREGPEARGAALLLLNSLHGPDFSEVPTPHRLCPAPVAECRAYSAEPACAHSGTDKVPLHAKGKPPYALETPGLGLWRLQG